MVHFRTFFSFPSEIEPDMERFVKRVIYYCLYSNFYVEPKKHMQELRIRRIGDALNIISHLAKESIQKMLSYYSLSRITVQSHLDYLYKYLRVFYDTVDRINMPRHKYLFVLCLGMESLYLMWRVLPREETRDITYATMYVLSRMFSSGEFRRVSSMPIIENSALRIIVNNTDVVNLLRMNPKKPYANPPLIDMSYFDDYTRPDDRYSPQSPLSNQSWSDSAVSRASGVVSTTSADTSSGEAPASSSETSRGTPTPSLETLSRSASLVLSTPSPDEPPLRRMGQPACMPRFRMFNPRFRFFPRCCPRFHFFSRFNRFRRFLLACPRRPFQ